MGDSAEPPLEQASSEGLPSAGPYANWPLTPVPIDTRAGAGSRQPCCGLAAIPAGGTGTVWSMVKSFYKGQPPGKRPPCLICMGPGRGQRELVHMPHGVSVWLCGAHRSPEFLTRRAGRDLVASLVRAWGAAGCLTRARHRALDAHRDRLTRPPGRARPGSYAWPELRREAEGRFAAGEPPARVIAELLSRAAVGSARPPSRRTMLRWFREGRWLDEVRPDADVVYAATTRSRPRSLAS